MQKYLKIGSKRNEISAARMLSSASMETRLMRWSRRRCSRLPFHAVRIYHKLFIQAQTVAYIGKSGVECWNIREISRK